MTVPAGYAMLCDAMEADASLRDGFFRNLRYVGFGGAVLPDPVAQRLRALSRAARGREIPIYSFYGATEFLFGTLQYWNSPRMDVIGLPLPAVELKLAPVDGKFELRVRTPTLMPRSGYLGASIPDEQLFDEDGFYRTGDAVRWCDDADPEQGIVFDGRVVDEFKLATGTFVCVTPLCTELLSACDPLVQHIVVCGLNEAWVGLLVWLDARATATLTGEQAAAALRERLQEHNRRNPGALRRIRRALVMSTPLSYDRNELTDKGTVSQIVTRTRRADDVRRLYDTPHDGPAGADLIDLG
ncbi:MAG: AMP-binding protein [Betaproteobacteria bacterium]